MIRLVTPADAGPPPIRFLLDLWRRDHAGDPRGVLLAQKGRNYVEITREPGGFRISGADRLVPSAVRAAHVARQILNRGHR